MDTRSYELVMSYYYLWEFGFDLLLCLHVCIFAERELLHIPKTVPESQYGSNSPGQLGPTGS